MNRETYDALVASVEKWRKNATVPASEGLIDGHDCPLCVLFVFSHEDEHRDCVGCPVSAATGETACSNTPYYAARLARATGKATGNSKHWQAAAQREADFLAALVPAGGPDE